MTNCTVNAFFHGCRSGKQRQRTQWPESTNYTNNFSPQSYTIQE